MPRPTFTVYLNGVADGYGLKGLEALCPKTIEIIEPPYEDEEGGYIYPTLRDISILLYASVGQGVQWNLAHEISKRTGISYIKACRAITEIVREYAKMTPEEGMDAMQAKPTPPQRYIRSMYKK